MAQVLTKKIAFKALQDFFQQTPFLLFGTGTSCALDTRFGMKKLRDHLLKDLLNIRLNDGQQKEWDLVAKNLEAGLDLESAMNAIQDDYLTQRIVESTANLVSSIDREYSSMILSGKQIWPASSLLLQLFKGLTETNRILHVATPNYDLLAEYAFERNAIPYITGFYGGVCRKRSWSRAACSILYKEMTSIRGKLNQEWKLQKHIRLYKVHGSLNTFKLNTEIVENNAWMYDHPSNIERMLVTPGTSKYQQLHQNRSDLLGEFDQAIEKHSSFLFVGFGFNDNQLCNDAIKRKLKEQKCPGLIITRDSNSRIAEYVKECENLWLICKNQTNSNNGTSIYNSHYQNSVHLDNKYLWNPSEFTREILGG